MNYISLRVILSLFRTFAIVKGSFEAAEDAGKGFIIGGLFLKVVGREIFGIEGDQVVGLAEGNLAIGNHLTVDFYLGEVELVGVFGGFFAGNANMGFFVLHILQLLQLKGFFVLLLLLFLFVPVIYKLQNCFSLSEGR